jgi:predicted amidohydrolase YtcJ
LSERVSVSGVKWLLDGSPLERSAAMRAPYADDPRTSGQVNFPPEAIRAILREASRGHTQLLFHAVGDRTAETLLSAMEATGGAKFWPPQRLRIEHGDGLMPDLIARVKASGAIVVQNPTHFADGEFVARRLGPVRAAAGSPLNTLLAAGIPVVLASDGEAEGPELNPWMNLRFASEYPAKRKESLTREQAMIAYTRTAAFAEFAEDKKGTLEAGKLADLAILSQDIFNIPSKDLEKTESVMTIVGGKIIYSSGALVQK